jgi:hypothetical protein
VREIIAWVRLRLPPGMTPEQGAAELRRAIGFGHPDVTLMDVVEVPDEQDS